MFVYGTWCSYLFGRGLFTHTPQLISVVRLDHDHKHVHLGLHGQQLRNSRHGTESERICIIYIIQERDGGERACTLDWWKSLASYPDVIVEQAAAGVRPVHKPSCYALHVTAPPLYGIVPAVHSPLYRGYSCSHLGSRGSSRGRGVDLLCVPS